MHDNLWLDLFAAIINFFPRAGDVLSYMLAPALFNLSLTASIVIVAVLVVRIFLRKAPRAISYALWIVVAFRLVCPFSFSSDFSLLNALDAPVTAAGSIEYVPVDIVHTKYPSVDVLIPEISDAINEHLPQGNEQLGADPLEAPAALAFWIWLIGFSAMLLWALISYFNLRHKLRTAILLEGNVFQSEHVGSPFILGLFRPKIYIPFGLDETTLKYVLAHEQYHLKRLDHIVKVFSFILLTVHWFNPLCWLAFHLMSKDMEISCDEKVLSQDKNIKTEYSTILLSFATNRRFPSPSPLAFGETGAKSRIKNALKWKQPKVWVTVLSVVLCIVVIAVCAANPKEETSNQDESPYEWTSTVRYEDVHDVSVQLLNTAAPATLNLNSDGIRDLISHLNAITPNNVYTGRGIPAQLKIVVTLSTGKAVTLRYGSNYIEITYPGITSKEGSWMLQNAALSDLMSKWLTSNVHDLSKVDSVTILTSALSNFRFRTNSSTLLVEFLGTTSAGTLFPLTVDLYATNSEDPVHSFSLNNAHMRGFSFSGLTPDENREYYLDVDTPVDLYFTISEGPAR